METSPQKRKKKKNGTANHLKQSKLYAYGDPCLLTLRVHWRIQTTARIHRLANLSELNWGIDQFEVRTGKAKMQYPIMNNQDGQI